MAAGRPLHDRPHLRPPLRRAVLRAEPDGAGDLGDQRPAAGSRRLLGRPDHLRLQAGVRAGEGLPRPARVRVARRHPGQPRLRATSATSTSRSCSATAARCCGSAASPSSPSTRPSPTSTTARSAAAATRGSRSSSPTTPSCASSCSTTTCCRCRARAASGTSSTTPATRSSACSAPACRLVLSGHKHVPYAWRLENIFIVNAGTVSSLRLRGNTRPCYNVDRDRGRARRRLAPLPVPRAGADHPVLDRDAGVREVHGADRGGAHVAG